MLHIYVPKDDEVAEAELAFLRSHGIPFEHDLFDLGALRAIGAPVALDEPVVTDGIHHVVGFHPARLLALAADQEPT